MATWNQKNASKINGARSKGPVTPEGKAKVSQNGCKHGLYAKQTVLRNEDPAQYAVKEFILWYNESHRHSGISKLTRSMLHHGEAAAVIAHRQTVLDRACALHPRTLCQKTAFVLPGATSG